MIACNLPPFSFPKSTKIASKIDPKMHQIFDRFLHRFFFHFGSILEPKLGPCWPHFPSKWGDPVGRRPPFCWVYVIFRFFGRPGPLLAQFGLDFGRFGPPFWKFWGAFWRFLVMIWVPCGLYFWYFFKLFFFKSSIGTLRCWAGGVARSAKNFPETRGLGGPGRGDQIISML